MLPVDIDNDEFILILIILFIVRRQHSHVAYEANC